MANFLSQIKARKKPEENENDATSNVIAITPKKESHVERLGYGKPRASLSPKSPILQRLLASNSPLKRTPVKISRLPITPVKLESQVVEKPAIMSDGEREKYKPLLDISKSIRGQATGITDVYKSIFLESLKRLKMEDGIPIEVLKKIKATWEDDNLQCEDKSKRNGNIRYIKEAYKFLSNYIKGEYVPEIKQVCKPDQADAASCLSNSEKSELGELLKINGALSREQVAKLYMILCPPKAVNFTEEKLNELKEILNIRQKSVLEKKEIEKLKKLPRIQENIDFTPEQIREIQKLLPIPTETTLSSEQISRLKSILLFPENRDFTGINFTNGCIIQVINKCTETLDRSWDNIKTESEQLIDYELTKSKRHYSSKLALLKSINLPYKNTEEVSIPEGSEFKRDAYSFNMPRTAEILSIALSSLANHNMIDEYGTQITPNLERLSGNVLLLRDRNNTRELFIKNSPLIGLNIKGRADFPSLESLNNSFFDTISYLWPKEENGLTLKSLNRNLNSAFTKIFPNLENREKIVNQVVDQYIEKFITNENEEIGYCKDDINSAQESLASIEKTRKLKDSGAQLTPEQTGILKRAERTTNESNATIEQKNSEILKHNHNIELLVQHKLTELPDSYENGKTFFKLSEIHPECNVYKELAVTTIICVQESIFRNMQTQIEELPCYTALKKTELLNQYCTEMDEIFSEAVKQVDTFLNETKTLYDDACNEKRINPDAALSEETLNLFKVKSDEISDHTKYPYLSSAKFEDEWMQMNRDLGIPQGLVKMRFASEKEQISSLLTQVMEKDNIIERLQGMISNVQLNPDAGSTEASEIMAKVMPIFQAIIVLCEQYGELQYENTELLEKNGELSQQNMESQEKLDLISEELKEICRVTDAGIFIAKTNELYDVLLEINLQKERSLER